MIRSKGHLTPNDQDVVMTRLALSEGVGDLVRHVWVGRWHVAEGRVSTQRVLTYPGCNVVMTLDEATLYGPAPRASTRELRGSSWVVGVLLHPAATVVLSRTPPRALVGGSEPLARAPWAAVRRLMDADARGGDARVPDGLSGLLQRWLEPLAGRVDASGKLANTVCHVAETDTSVRQVGDLAERVGMAQRTLHRLLTHRVGVSARWLIERRRLQDAAAVLRDHPDVSLAELAVDLGYADQAHFTRRFHEIVGRTPGQAREASR